MRGPFRIKLDRDFEFMLNCAMRYCLGRRTYAPGLFCSYVMPLLPCLSDSALENLRYNFSMTRDYGDNCDKDTWLKFHAAIEREISRRKENA